MSLLKILLTNFCIFDCAYCVNRVSSNVRRARFSTDEVVRLTLDFYKRNYIEGLFLSSGIIRDSDYTMERLVEVARCLREDHRFAGYIHLKTIPDASPELLAAAGRYADRLSINVELPTETGLATLAPEKNLPRIRAAMGDLRWRIEEGKEARKTAKVHKPPKFAPAGQSTQMIVGADGADDRAILLASDNLYGNYRLRRVYYSGFSPIPDASSKLPLQAPPLATRTSPVPGRLVAALLRIRRRRNRAGRCVDDDARPGHRSETRLGPAQPRALPGGPQHARRGRCCCACRAWERATSHASCNRAAMAACGSAISRACAHRWRRCCRS